MQRVARIRGTDTNFAVGCNADQISEAIAEESGNIVIGVPDPVIARLFPSIPKLETAILTGG